MTILNAGAMVVGYFTLAIIVWWSLEPHVERAMEGPVRWFRSELLWRFGLTPPPYETLPGPQKVERV